MQNGQFDKSGQKIGKWIYYFSNNKIKEVGTYKNGKDIMITEQ